MPTSLSIVDPAAVAAPRKTFSAERNHLSASELLKFRIAATIGETFDLAHAMGVALEAVCQETGWTFGEAWVPCEDCSRIRCCEAWYALQPGFEAFRAATEEHCFTPGEVLPGLAWERREPVFIPDVTCDPTFRRREAAAALGIKAGAAFPILVNDTPVAILEFFMLEARSEDENLVALIAAVTTQLGTILQHKELEERLRKHEAELARLNRIKDHFLAMLAHELRNPLAPILNAVEMLRSPDPADAVDVIERQVKHMARLLDDLLDISGATMGKISLKRTKIDLVETVRAAARTARPSCTDRGLLLSMTLPPGSLWVEADPVRIEQVVANLLNNAVKSTSSAGGQQEICLTLERDNGEAMLRVRDRGIGIPAEMLERIFEPFVQLDDPMQRTRGGLGLGLSLVRQFVEMHGGRVLVASNGLGHGAEFSVCLPMTDPPAKLEAAPAGSRARTSATTAKTPNRPRRRVLVVEDNTDLANTLARLLTLWGHDPKIVNEGAVAVAAAIEHRAQVAILDIGLPEMDGCVLARRLKAIPQLHGLRIIAMTGYGQESDRARAAEAGFTDYLLKPVDPAFLRTLVESV